MNNFTLSDAQMFAKKIIDNLQIMKTKQLVNCIKNNYKVEDTYALSALQLLQKRRFILLSQDGYAMTLGYYMTYASDKFNDKLDYSNNEFIINYDIGKYLELDKNQIDSYWILAEMIDIVEDYAINSSAWNLWFGTKPEKEEPGKAFFVTSFNKNNYQAKRLFHKNFDSVNSNSWRDLIVKIAIVSDPKLVEVVPYVGFKYIVMIDEKTPKGMKILSLRKNEDAWKDWPEVKNDRSL